MIECENTLPKKKKNQRKNEELRISVAKVLLKHFVQRHFQEHYSW